MRPCFVIYTFKEPGLLGRTCAALRPFPVIVHVDAKVAIEPFQAEIQPADRGRVEFLAGPERVRVNWGGYSQVVAIRRLLRRAVSIGDPDDYIFLLSGQDYPIKSLISLTRYLGARPRRQHIRFFDVTSGDPKYTRQVTRRHHRDLPFLSGRFPTPVVRRTRNAAVRAVDLLTRSLPAPRAPEGFRVAQGPTHFAITGLCAAYVEQMVTPEIERYFRAVFCPEEKFVQSLVANSPFLTDTPAGGFETYAGPGNWRYQNLHHIDPSLVKVFTESDWDEVRVSQQFFLRKVELERSRSLLDRIDLELLNVQDDGG